MREKLKKQMPLFLLLLVTLVVGFPLFKTKLLNGHDGVFQLFRCYTTGIAIQDGQLIPMVNPDMIGGFGYATNMFYGALVTYVVTFLSLFIKPIGLVINLVIVMTIFLLGLFTYRFLKDITESKKASLVGAIIYMTSPYLLFDIYVRMALGEILSFAFLPLLFHGLYNVIEKDGKKWYLLTIGTVLLFLSHTVSTLMAALFAFLYLLCNIKKVWKKEVVKKLALSLGFALLMSMATILPLLEVKLSSDYMVFDSTYMRTTGEKMEARAINLFDGICSEVWLIAVGLIVMLVIAFGVTFYFGKRKKKDVACNQFLILAFISIFLTFSVIPWSLLPEILSTIQFPWRFLQLASFFLSLSFALLYQKVEKHKVSNYLSSLVVVCLIVAIPFVKLGIENPGIDNELVHSNRLKKRGDIVRSTGSASAEYLPRNAIYKYEYLSNRALEPVLLSGKGTIQNVRKNGTKLSFDMVVEENSLLELPYIYYPGYVVKVNEKKVPIIETENGMVGVRISQGNVHVMSQYRGSNVMIAAYSISLVSGFIFVVFVIKGGKKKYEANK